MSEYQTLPQLEEEWRGLEAAYPSLAKLHSIGQFVQGRNIIVLQVSEYQTLPQLQEEWRGWETAYPSLAKLHSIGQSVQGRNIIVLQVSEYQTLPQLEEERVGGSLPLTSQAPLHRTVRTGQEHHSTPGETRPSPSYRRNGEGWRQPTPH